MQMLALSNSNKFYYFECYEKIENNKSLNWLFKNPLNVDYYIECDGREIKLLKFIVYVSPHTQYLSISPYHVHNLHILSIINNNKQHSVFCLVFGYVWNWSANDRNLLQAK